MRFLVDAQLPPALARWLDGEGHRAEHVSDLEMDSASDEAIWQRAASDGAAIITKDEDFALRAVTRSVHAPPVVWIRVGNTRRAELLRWFGPLLSMVVSKIEAGETLIEIQ